MEGLVLKFPTNVEMDFTTQQYTRDSAKLLGQKLCPLVNTQAQVVESDELDNDVGMTGVHTMDTDPRVRRRPGSRLHSFEPIPHKETELIKESEMLKARAWGTLGGVINIEYLVMDAFRRAMGMDDIRIEWEIWQMFQGELNIDENGYKLEEEFAIQEFTPNVAWDDLENAKVLSDLDTVSQMFVGTGASAQGAVMVGNGVTLNKIFENKNTDDLKGFTNENFRVATYSVEDLNKLLTARKRPTFLEYDEGFYRTKQEFEKFIPDGTLIVVGKRMAGQQNTEYKLTPTLHRTQNGMPAPGRFAFLTVNGQPNVTGTQAVSLQQLGQHGNPNIGVVHGFYGGPIMRYPRSIIKVNAF